MTTIEIILPDQLAQEAQRAGLLTSDTIERMLREQLRKQNADELFAAVERMAALDEPPPMTPAEVAEELRVMRAERQARR